MSKKTITVIVWITLFAVAMGYLESAVVVYLRKIYYPDGFTFPLHVIDQDIGITEIFREFATLIMLAGAGIIAGRTRTEKFGFFIYCFAIWDIFYYVFLKLLLGWPESLMTWDILFLIPVTWVGPVIGPVINSLTMIVLALLISHFTDKNSTIKIQKIEWLMFAMGSLIIIISYTRDYSNYILSKFTFGELFSLPPRPEVSEYALGYVPESFPWWIFWNGQVIIFGGIYLFYKRTRGKLTKNHLG